MNSKQHRDSELSKAYPSNLTRDQYEFLSDLIPEAKPGGRKREVDMWESGVPLKIWAALY